MAHSNPKLIGSRVPAVAPRYRSETAAARSSARPTLGASSATVRRASGRLDIRPVETVTAVRSPWKRDVDDRTGRVARRPDEGVPPHGLPLPDDRGGSFVLAERRRVLREPQP